VEYIAHMKEMRNSYKHLVGKPEGKKTIERSRRSRKNIIKIGLKEIGYKSVE
jgi:hypothetical protein